MPDGFVNHFQYLGCWKDGEIVATPPNHIFNGRQGEDDLSMGWTPLDYTVSKYQTDMI